MKSIVKHTTNYLMNNNSLRWIGVRVDLKKIYKSLLSVKGSFYGYMEASDGARKINNQTLLSFELVWWLSRHNTGCFRNNSGSSKGSSSYVEERHLY